MVDGGGVRPDIEVSAPQSANITYSLYANNLIFDFATQYASQHPSIAKPLDFEITDSIYSDFMHFVQRQKLDYNSQSSEKLDELIKISKREGYYKLAEAQIEELHSMFSSDTQQDLQHFRGEIEELLKA